MKVVVLGKGFVSKYIVNFLMGSGHEVLHLSRKEYDYHDEVKLDELLYGYKGVRYDTIINTAGFTGKPNVDQCEEKKDECFYYNVTLPKNIESLCKKHEKRFIHISSGCIYTGYDKPYTEEDTPNFGLFNEDSSFYSLSKHASELVLDETFTNIIRIRMPLCDDLSSKNLLTKLLNYDYIIDFVNSKTDVYKLSEFVNEVVKNFKPGIYNAVHSDPLSTKEVVEILKEYGLVNKKWTFVPYDELAIKANRSNCVLSNEKSQKDFNFKWESEEVYIRLNASLIQKRKEWKK